MRAARNFTTGSRVLVLGTGVSGTSMASWCLRQGLAVAVGDPAGEGRDQLDPHVWKRHGPATEAWLEDVDTVLMSPGIPPRSPQVDGLLTAADSRGIPVLSELDLFVAALAELELTQGYRPEVVAITGTNGKTTTTMLTTRMLVASGRNARAAGNVGPALMDALTEAMATNNLPDTWVLELSSFQLFYGADFVPSIGVLLNVTPDHLDWHGTFDDYARVKFRVLEAPIAIVCRDDAVAMSGVREAAESGSVATIGTGTPPNPGALGIGDLDGTACLVLRDSHGEIQPIVRADALKIRGDHALIDAQASLAVVEQLNALNVDALVALTTYLGEPHRTELVASIGGVDFVDDSKATNVAATIAALEACAGYRRVVLIVGGEAKGQTFERLQKLVQRHVAHVLTVGHAADALEAALGGLGAPVERVHTVPHAVARAAQLAEPGDVVLLSPACASTDSFTNFAERGRCFQAAVAQHADARAQELGLAAGTGGRL